MLGPRKGAPSIAVAAIMVLFGPLVAAAPSTSPTGVPPGPTGFVSACQAPAGTNLPPIGFTSLTPGEIRRLQRRLERAGVYDGPATGRFDVETLAALKAFQHARDLPVTGQLDPATVRALGLNYAALRDRPAPEVRARYLTPE